MKVRLIKMPRIMSVATELGPMALSYQKWLELVPKGPIPIEEFRKFFSFKVSDDDIRDWEMCQKKFQDRIWASEPGPHPSLDYFGYFTHRVKWLSGSFPEWAGVLWGGTADGINKDHPRKISHDGTVSGKAVAALMVNAIGSSGNWYDPMVHWVLGTKEEVEFCQKFPFVPYYKLAPLAESCCFYCGTPTLSHFEVGEAHPLAGWGSEYGEKKKISCHSACIGGRKEGYCIRPSFFRGSESPFEILYSGFNPEGAQKVPEDCEKLYRSHQFSNTLKYEASTSQGRAAEVLAYGSLAEIKSFFLDGYEIGKAIEGTAEISELIELGRKAKAVGRSDLVDRAVAKATGGGL